MKVVIDKSIIKLLIILVLAFGLRAALLNLRFAHFIGFNPNRKEILVYKDEVVEDGPTLLKPVFNDDYLNGVVDKYLVKNNCKSLDYDVFVTEEEIVNLYLNCGVRKNVIYDYRNRKTLSISDLVNDKKQFNDKVNYLLNLKYPRFVSGEVDILNSIYDINETELELFFTTLDYGEVSVKINNNEIPNLMKYDMKYDDIYENEIFSLDASKPTIAFSFDDGPSTYDLKIIDALVDSHATATFFLVGNRINSFKDSVNKMIENNMEVGNHSYNHKYMKKMSKSQVADQINKTNLIYRELTGRDMTLFRPPYGAINNSTLIGPGVPAILWSIDTLDWQSRDKDKVYEIIMENAKDGDIVLMHSLYESTLEAVEMALPELYKRGFQVVSVGELAKLKGRILVPGTSYLSLRNQ